MHKKNLFCLMPHRLIAIYIYMDVIYHQCTIIIYLSFKGKKGLVGVKGLILFVCLIERKMILV